MWRQATERFRKALDDVERLRADREAAAAALRQRPQAEKALHRARRAVDETARRVTSARDALTGAETVLGRAEE
ncbi:hypothetical protein FH609_030330 [Streptomyces sp. 3MP-14]|uniref:Uncharacterized protein n=1 Tax=Streptomyces mimosae TaxID=2586635 RepID=A0A5N5ZSD8_9ACTN|nr:MULTISPECIES: hypothetical protein [Streptomyces]KAB8157858.1 hypothetical protein FH607_029945 [Streptomyces mimosae]KAB8172313.1 hypothetical protein FH609_030330 [Streptomyces sp. 3MP-14]